MAKWIYKQSTGELYRDGKLIETGYSGILTNKNNPDREQVRGMGPIPRGTWRIGSAGTSKGPLTITLVPLSVNAYDRDMWVHSGCTETNATASEVLPLLAA